MVYRLADQVIRQGWAFIRSGRLARETADFLKEQEIDHGLSRRGAGWMVYLA